MKISLTDLANLQNETTAVVAINSNNNILETAFDNTLSRDGTSPNTMQSNLDMNSNRIINLPDAVGNGDPVTLSQLNASTTPAGNVPSGGSTNQVLTKNSNTNFDTAWKTTGVSSIAGNTGAFILTGGLSNEANVLIINMTSTPQLRLSLASGSPVMSSSVAGAATVYYTPYTGQWVPIFDGVNFVNFATVELSQATTDTTKSPAAVAANSIYDIFVWVDGPNLRATRGPAWTNSTTRSAGTALVRVGGLLLNNASITNGPAAQRGTYVGSIASNGSSTIDYILGSALTGGSAAVLNVWNMYNRVTTATSVIDSGATYTYTTGTIRQARASAGNQITFLLGLPEDGVYFSYQAAISLTATVGSNISFGVGFDSASTYGQQFNIAQNSSASGIAASSSSNSGIWLPGIGTHILSANEKGDGSNANTFNNSLLNNLSIRIRN